MKLKEKMKNNNHKKFDKKKLIGLSDAVSSRKISSSDTFLDFIS